MILGDIIGIYNMKTTILPNILICIYMYIYMYIYTYICRYTYNNIDVTYRIDHIRFIEGAIGIPFIIGQFNGWIQKICFDQWRFHPESFRATINRFHQVNMGYIGSRPGNIWFEPSKKETIRVFKWGKYERWN